MERSLTLLLMFITLATIHIVQAQDQQGFISLDCGLPANEPSSYNETGTGLLFSTDESFIQSGQTGRIRENPNGFPKPYETLRYFPEGIRNCYNLNVIKGRKYLIRASFVYGNYDGLDIKPVFNIYLGPNPWAKIDLERQDGTREEMLHIPTSVSLQICLVRTGETTPLISALELRPVRNDSHDHTQSGSLQLVSRTYLSESKTTFIRYPDDAYDQLWIPMFSADWTHIYTTSYVYNDNRYNLPKYVRENAATPTNADAPLTITWPSKDPGDQYYLFEHFAEIQDLQANETREFMVVLNGKVVSSPVTPKNFTITTMESMSPITCEGRQCSLQLTRTKRSTLPPLLNAFIIYRVIQFLQSETNEKDVVAIKSIKDFYELTRISWQGDPCVPQHFMWDGLNCSNTIIISTPPRITSLNLSSARLSGTIAAAIEDLAQLEKLDLSNNNLTGEVPEFLGNMKSLVFINLSGNDLDGSIPQTLQRKGVELVLHGNPRLCQPGSCIKPHSRSFPVAIVASVVSIAILVAALVLFLVLRKKKLSTVEVTAPQLPPSMMPMVNVTSANSHEPLIEMKRRRFTYSEVMEMTNNFQRVLGKGGFGDVYHGTLNDSEEVAVKVLSQSSTQGSKQFKAEVDLLLRVHHTNLVSLVGYCDEEDHLSLIYEFVPNGDLKEHLSGKQGRPIINWGMRLRIAIEAALGLEYLHIGCTPPMIHRDVKTANILLGEHFKAKLADFGLSRSFPIGGESHVSTMIAGTLGYLDPEYYLTCRLSEKSDVYSFGIVLLEMMTNQPVIDQTREESHIAHWARFELNGGDITKIMDPNLHEEYDSRSAWRALELAMSCTNPSSSRRPDMSQVVAELKGCLVYEKSRGNMNMESQSSTEVSMNFDSEMFPLAR